MYVDLTMEVGPATPVYPGSPAPAVLQWSRYDVHGYYSNVLFMPEHVGTHVDAPAHFVPGGRTVDQIEAGRFFGRFVALDFSGLPPRGEVGLREFERALPRGVELGPGWFVLFRTGYHAGVERWLDHPDISPELAEHLAKLGVYGVGTDAPSPDHPPFEVHRILLAREVLIFENLANLGAVVGKTGQFVALPLKVAGGSGAPVRAVALV
ncbi:cyclase family protein [Pyrobaculum neutrophilum]|uniref:Cyclase family protein n=1 Tax=Pyrobaculum neutrophilum (strain DSM 2338 / JCM 9278 / NBRC 100436 / V24Sta) TaxID=444157 RepID=B1YDP5_PYRNV|nr:cyclase family protein [Pyrobaculum neutrophilum]ACB39908.1 cyclase family protein [Pyrobaculum neutrophilum V24Sta]